MSAVYGHFKGSLMIGEPNTNLIAGDVRVGLVSSAYTFDPSHKFLTDIPDGSLIATSDPLTGKTINASALAAFDSINPVLVSVTGNTVVAVVLFIDTGAPATSRLVSFQNTGLGGIPFTPSGVNETLVVDPQGWFVL